MCCRCRRRVAGPSARVVRRALAALVPRRGGARSEALSVRAICVTCFTLITPSGTAGSGRGHHGTSTASAAAAIVERWARGHSYASAADRRSQCAYQAAIGAKFCICRRPRRQLHNDSHSRRCRRRHRVLSSEPKELRTQTVFATFSGVAALRPMGLIFPKNLAHRKRLPGPWWDAAAEVGPSPFRAPWMAVSRCTGAYTPVAAPRLVVDPSWAATIY